MFYLHLIKFKEKNMVTIGQVLKQYRLHTGMTQQEMAAGIVSESFYSKVERGVHDIESEKLLAILAAHKFDIDSFFKHITIPENSYFDLESKIVFAKNKKDIKELDRIKDEIDKDNSVPQWIRFRLELAYAWVTHDNSQISNKLKRKMKKLVSSEKWERTSYYLLSQIVILLDIDDAHQLVDIAYAAYNKDKKTDAATMQTVSWIAVNYLNCCYHEHVDKDYAVSSIAFLRSLPVAPEFGMCAILGTYYEALFDHDEQMKDMIIKVLKRSNYLSLIEDTIA